MVRDPHAASDGGAAGDEVRSRLLAEKRIPQSVTPIIEIGQKKTTDDAKLIGSFDLIGAYRSAMFESERARSIRVA